MYKYFVESSEPISPSAQLVTLKSDENQPVLVFQPGQYAAISFFRKGRPTPARCFSIVSSPTEQGVLQFSMRTKGRFTNAVKTLKEGDEVRVRGPFGAFVFEPRGHHGVVLLAGGIGITPLLSMIRYATRLELQTKITLIYSCKTQDDAPFAEELVKMSHQNPKLKVIFVMAGGEISKFAGLNVARGRIDADLINKAVPKLAGNTFFICGPAGFMKGMQNTLESEGVDAANILTEAFSQGPNQQTGKIASWPFNIYSLGSIAVVLGSFIVTASDLAKTLPPSQILKQIRSEENEESTNTRQADLDQVINQLPTTVAAPSTATASTPTSTSATSTPAATSPRVTVPTCVSTPSSPC